MIRVFSPLAVTRAVNTAPGLVVVAAAVTVWVDTPDPGVVLGLLGLAPGAWMAVRGYRMAVLVDDTHLLVRGQLWSRRIARSSVRDVGEGVLMARVRWVDATGRRRWTPVLAFTSTSRTLPRFATHNEVTLRKVRAAVQGG